MDLLARREHAVQELRRKLVARGFQDALIETALATLAGEGLQDDARFADAFVHARVQRGQGPVKIRAGLFERGVEAELAAAAMEASGADWVALAREARLKRFGEVIPDEYRERARQMRFLAGRGFSAEQVHAAIGEDD